MIDKKSGKSHREGQENQERIALMNLSVYCSKNNIGAILRIIISVRKFGTSVEDVLDSPTNANKRVI